jgi:hypothetical protein
MRHAPGGRPPWGRVRFLPPGAKRSWGRAGAAGRGARSDGGLTRVRRSREVPPRHRASAIERRPAGIGHRPSGPRFKVQGSESEPSTFDVQPSTFILPVLFLPPRPNEVREFGGRAGAAGRGARSDPPRTRGGRRSTVPPPSPTPSGVGDHLPNTRPLRGLPRGGNKTRHPPKVGAGATSPNVVAFGSSWRRKQEATGTSRSSCAVRHATQASGVGCRASASRHRASASRFNARTFNLRPARSALVSPPSTERSEGVWGESRRSREGGTECHQPPDRVQLGRPQPPHPGHRSQNPAAGGNRHRQLQGLPRSGR